MLKIGNGIGMNLSNQELMWMRIKSEALLFPSGSEGFGYPPLESMACGTKGSLFKSW